MVNAYSELISYDGFDWEDYLNRICLIDIFKDLIPLFKDKDALTQGIRYIVWTYSNQSDCITLGTDWHENKKRIFYKTLLPDSYFQDLVELKNPIIVETIKRWIEFQDDATFSQLTMLKELKLEMQQSANSKILKSSGEIDFDQKFKNAGYVNDLKKDIDDLEQELIQNSPKLKEGVKEVRTKAKNTIGAESFAI